MATAYITTYFGASEVASGYVLDSEPLAVGTGSFTASKALDVGGKSNRIRVSYEADLEMERGGSAPDGTGHLERIPANSTEYFWLKAGDKIALKEV